MTSGAGAASNLATVAETRLRVRYAETDQMGVAYHSNFVIWFEVGRVELLRQLGFTYQQMERDDDCHLPVADLRCRFKAPARYDEELVIRASLKNVRDSLVHFAYEVVRASDGSLLAEGETVHVVTDGQLRKQALPQEYMEALRRAAGRG
jgi:acyl-CoA thioester hydrolase